MKQKVKTIGAGTIYLLIFGTLIVLLAPVALYNFFMNEEQ